MIDGTLLVSGDNGGRYFRLYTPVKEDTSDRQLKVRKITIKNVHHVGAQIIVESVSKQTPRLKHL